MAGRGGRPTEHGEVKNAPVSFRTTPEFRHKLEKAAEKEGRSLAQEMEQRLIRTFAEDDLMGGKHNNAFWRLMLASIQLVEERNGATWLEDEDTYHAVQGVVERLLRANRPSKPDSLQAEIAAAYENYKAAQRKQEAALDALTNFRDILPVPTKAPGGMFGRVGVVGQGGTGDQLGTILSRYLQPAPDTPREDLEKLAVLQAQYEASLTERDKAFQEYSSFFVQMAERALAAKRAGEEAAEENLRILGPKLKG